MSPRALAHGQAVVAFLDNLYAKTNDIPVQSATAPAPAHIEELVEEADTVAVTATARL